MKTCPCCETEKAIEEFGNCTSRDDGKSLYCLLCMRVKARESRKRRGLLKSDGWIRKAADKAAYAKEWSKAHPGYKTAKKAEWMKRNPERQKVKDAVKYAVKTGRLVPMNCMVCGDYEVQAHHPDYSRPLDVIWLCINHHVELHKNMSIE